MSAGPPQITQRRREAELKSLGYEVDDLGPASDSSTDYADYAHPLAAAQEVGVGEDGEARGLDEGRLGPDEDDPAGVSAGRRAGRRDPGSLGHDGSPKQ